jgi:hypothetical protein
VLSPNILPDSGSSEGAPFTFSQGCASSLYYLFLMNNDDLAKQKVAQGGLTQMVGCAFAPQNTVMVRIVPRTICSTYGQRWCYLDLSHFVRSSEGQFTTCQPLILFRNWHSSSQASRLEWLEAFKFSRIHTRYTSHNSVAFCNSLSILGLGYITIISCSNSPDPCVMPSDHVLVPNTQDNGISCRCSPAVTLNI